MENQKPLILRMDEAEQELVDAVNAIMQKHSLPCFLVEPMVDKIHRQGSSGKAAELAKAKATESEGSADENHE